MPNMIYCKFQNTVSDLRDCLDHMGDVGDLSSEEKRARLNILRMCADIAFDYEYEIMEDRREALNAGAR